MKIVLLLFQIWYEYRLLLVMYSTFMTIWFCVYIKFMFVNTQCVHKHGLSKTPE